MKVLGVTATTNWALPILNCSMVITGFLSTIYTFWIDRDPWKDLTINLLRCSGVFYCSSSIFYGSSSVFYVQNILEQTVCMDFHPIGAESANYYYSIVLKYIQTRHSRRKRGKGEGLAYNRVWRRKIDNKWILNKRVMSGDFIKGGKNKASVKWHIT